MHLGERQLRKELTRVLYSDRLLGQDMDQTNYTVDLVIDTLKSGQYFVYNESIREIQEVDFLDYNDGGLSYTTYVEGDIS